MADSKDNINQSSGRQLTNYPSAGNPFLHGAGDDVMQAPLLPDNPRPVADSAVMANHLNQGGQGGGNYADHKGVASGKHNRTRVANAPDLTGDSAGFSQDVSRRRLPGASRFPK